MRTHRMNALLWLLMLVGVVGSVAGNLAETKIAFTSIRDGIAEVYVMDYDGANQRRVTNFPEVTMHPSWSPEGSVIAFAQGDTFRDIFTMHADGSNIVNLTNDGTDSQGNPHISPDGTKIAYTTGSTPSDIIVIDIDGANPVNLTNSAFRNGYPRWSPDGSQIVFTSNRDGLWQVYVMEANGANQTNLSNSGVDDYEPEFSPDGTKIVFASNRDGDADIFVMDSTGTNQNPITVNAFANWSPSWAPDGTRIVYYGNPAGDAHIYTSDANGANEVQITNTAASDTNPNWMPFPLILEGVDGISIQSEANSSNSSTFTVKNQDAVTALNVSGITSDNAVFTASPASFSLAAGLTQVVTVTYSPVAIGSDAATITVTHDGPMGASVIGASGTAVITPRTGDLATTSIVFYRGDGDIMTVDYAGTTEVNLTPGTEVEYDPHWSPDGTKIVYDSAANGIPGLFVINTDGTGVVDLTADQTDNESAAAWSPDGTQIAFKRRVIATNETDIYKMDSDGSAVVRLTTDGLNNNHPAWSPDGARIVFQSARDGGQSEIYVMNADGSGQTRLTNNAYQDSLPQWSPDGAKIAFQADVDSSGVQEILLMNPDGTGQTNITNNAVFDGDPDWSPDGTRLVFRSKRDGQATNDLYHMAVDGTDVVRLTTSGQHDAHPSWGPFPSTATVTAADTQGRVGRVATVPINITDVRGLDLTAVTITLTYDSTILTPTDDGTNTTAVTPGAMVPVAWGLEQNVITPGTLSFSMAGGLGDPITAVGAGVLASIAFDVSPSATVGATSPLTLTEGNLNEGGVASTLTSGTLTVMTLVFGDVTGNGEVTAYDASWVLEYVAQDLVGTTIQFPIETTPPSWATIAILPADARSVADVDANSLVQAIDASLILQHDVDIISTFAADSAAPSRAVVTPSYQLTASATSERPDARITVSLDASSLDELYAGELALEFDAEIVRPVRVYLDRGTTRDKPPMLVRADGEGKLGVAFASAKPIARSDATLRIVFEPVGSIEGPVDGVIRSSRLGLNAARVDPAFVYRFHIEPFRFQALANYPNPFNPETWIPFELNEDSDVTIHIYGLDGQRVRTLEVGRRGMGVHAGRDAAAYWDGKNAFGEAVSSGVYVYELIAGSQRAMRRMVVLK